MTDEYNMIDRFLRNNLDDDDYEVFSNALSEISHGAEQARAAMLDVPLVNDGPFNGIADVKLEPLTPEVVAILFTNMHKSGKAGVFSIENWFQAGVTMAEAAHGITKD